MNVYKELKEIVDLNNKIKILAQLFEDKFEDIDGLDFSNIYIIEGCIVKNNRLYDSKNNRLDNGGGIVDNDYFCHQTTGCCEDDFYGTMYFATEVEDTYIAVPFMF